MAMSGFSFANGSPQGALAASHLEAGGVPLVPEPGRLVTFVAGGADARRAQALGQAQVADASSDDGHMQVRSPTA